jgi:hypothetical protein
VQVLKRNQKGKDKQLIKQRTAYFLTFHFAYAANNLPWIYKTSEVYPT